MIKHQFPLILLVIVGFLFSAIILQENVDSNMAVKETCPFSVDFYERFSNHSLYTPIAPIDFEQDGDSDFIYVNSYKILLEKNVGFFNSNEEPIFMLDHNGDNDYMRHGGLMTEDLNNDGYADIIMGGAFGRLRVLYNQKDGTFAEICFGDFGQAMFGIDTVDWNDDGLSDIVFSYATSPMLHSKIMLIINKGNFDFEEPLELFTIEDHYIFSLNAEDYDNDSDIDVLYSISELASNNANYADGIINLLINNDEDVFSEIQISRRGDGEFHLEDTRMHPHIASADFDEDGDIDIVFGDNSGIVELLINEGDATFETSFVLRDFGDVSVTSTADYDMDGDIDIIVTTLGYNSHIDGGFYIIYNNIIPMSLQTPQPNHLYLFDNQLDFGDSSLLIGPTTFRINRQVETDYVEFYVNDRLMHTDSSYPFEWRWSKLHFGEAYVKIIGYFADGTTYTLQEQYTKLF